MLLSRQNIAIQERVVEMTQVQFDSGNVSELDVQQARTQLYATQAALPGLNISRLQSANAIAVLPGELPENIEPMLVFEETAKIPAYDERMKQGVADSQSTESIAQYNDRSLIPFAPDIQTAIDPNLVRWAPGLQSPHSTNCACRDTSCSHPARFWLSWSVTC